jgi:hypothetical protein
MQIHESTTKSSQVVLKLTKSEVAASTKQPTHLLTLVTMIDRRAFLEGLLADLALALCSLLHLLISDFCEPVLRQTVRGPIVFLRMHFLDAQLAVRAQPIRRKLILMEMLGALQLSTSPACLARREYSSGALPPLLPQSEHPRCVTALASKLEAIRTSLVSPEVFSWKKT